MATREELEQQENIRDYARTTDSVFLAVVSEKIDSYGWEKYSATITFEGRRILNGFQVRAIEKN